jgi:PAS domain S-box-containing protein
MMSSHQQQESSYTASASRRQRVLLVDDDRVQLKLSALRLRRAGFIVTTASSAREALELAKADPPDAILSDVIMAEVDGFSLCRRLRQQSHLADVPILLMSAHYGDKQARQLAAQVGASALVGRTPGFHDELRALHDVLGNERPSGEQPITKDVAEAHLRSSANEMVKLADEAKFSDDRYRALFENANDAIALLSRSGVVREANERWRSVLGVPGTDLLGKHFLDFAPRARETAGAELDGAIARGFGHVNAVEIERPDAPAVYLDFSITVIELAAGPLVLAMGREVTDRVLAGQALALAEAKYRALVGRLPDVVWTAAEGVLTFVTSNVEGLTGFTSAELCATGGHFWRQRMHLDDRTSLSESPFDGLAGAAGGPGFDRRYRWRRKDGAWVWLWHRTIGSYERSGVRHSEGLISDITQQRLLEESLRQSQKMEALGQLTGGITHDFNNILGVILGSSQFLLDAMSDDDPKLADVHEIKLAAERAASLTSQLLAFSRRQVLELRVTDLNLVVAGMERLLRRLIGADIQMTIVLGEKLGRVRVDPGQIEQVLMNLAVNARDAMPRGGMLTIETMNVESVASSPTHDAARPGGRQVSIAVSDTGLGMDPETQRRAFEPFFTTKGLGKGSGLGLATCHGIVSQCGGHIELESQLALGSVFKVYLPQLDAEVAERERAPRLLGEEIRGNETVLLVEDDPPLCAAVRRMLTAQGYNVLVARASEAADLAKLHGSTVALLLTDVVMPILSGPEVARVVEQHAPYAKVLFMSGYADHGALTSGRSSQTFHFIQKPFSAKTLAQKVRETLDG